MLPEMIDTSGAGNGVGVGVGIAATSTVFVLVSLAGLLSVGTLTEAMLVMEGTEASFSVPVITSGERHVPGATGNAPLYVAVYDDGLVVAESDVTCQSVPAMTILLIPPGSTPVMLIGPGAVIAPAAALLHTSAL